MYVLVEDMLILETAVYRIFAWLGALIMLEDVVLCIFLVDDLMPCL